MKMILFLKFFKYFKNYLNLQKCYNSLNENNSYHMSIFVFSYLRLAKKIFDSHGLKKKETIFFSSFKFKIFRGKEQKKNLLV